uniref:Uncharacterized protein n=1 Tax=Paramoeba aestuarina TaxID=180227 RepID=A0A7S4KVS8_9EUKA
MLIELFIDKITNKEEIVWICQFPNMLWGGVKFGPDGPIGGKYFDEEDNIIEITLHGIGLRGGIQMEWLPPSTIECTISSNELSGTINLEVFPGHLKRLMAGSNMFSGTICLTNLPNTLEVLGLMSNQ